MKLNKHITFDFDSTLVNTTACAINLCNKIYNTNIDLENLDYSKVQWDLANVLTTLSTQQINDLFKHPNLYDNLEDYIFDSWKTIMCELKLSGYTLDICTIHRKDGVDKKLEIIKKHFPMVDNINIISAENHGDLLFDKSCVKGGIHLDDKLDCLESSCSELKIVCGMYDWNKDNKNYIRVTNPYEFYVIIKNIETLYEKFSD